MGKKIDDLVNVETEHLLGLNTGLPLVKMRAESNRTVIVGQMSPEQAREIASHLMESAARAEYEHDLMNEMKKHEWEDEMIGGIFLMVRQGEMRRHTGIA